MIKFAKEFNIAILNQNKNQMLGNKNKMKICFEFYITPSLNLKPNHTNPN